MRQQWGDCAFCTLSLKRHTNSFAVVENISMWFCLSLTHKKSSLRNISENENFSVLINMQTERSGQSKNLYSHTNTWFRTELVCSHGFSVTDI